VYNDVNNSKNHTNWKIKLHPLSQEKIFGDQYVVKSLILELNGMCQCYDVVVAPVGLKISFSNPFCIDISA